MMAGTEKREPGRPRTGRKPRVDFTISQESIDFMLWLLGEQGNQSKFVDGQIKAHPRYEEYQEEKRTRKGRP